MKQTCTWLRGPHVLCSTFGIFIIPVYSLNTISFMKALIKSHEAAPLNQVFYLLSFHFSFHWNPSKGLWFHMCLPLVGYHLFCSWWVSFFAWDNLQSSPSFWYHGANFSPTKTYCPIVFIYHSHSPCTAAVIPKRQNTIAVWKHALFIWDLMTYLLFPEDYMLWHFAQSNRYYKQLFLKLWPLFLFAVFA